MYAEILASEPVCLMSDGALLSPCELNECRETKVEVPLVRLDGTVAIVRGSEFVVDSASIVVSNLRSLTLLFNTEENFDDSAFPNYQGYL